jgi:hypothetical protein
MIESIFVSILLGLSDSESNNQKPITKNKAKTNLEEKQGHEQ